ncbi:MAG: DUF108 domain-containing protein [Actinomycetia bacterium]|nr:DUF108 domain-containing protein [Actinomycetes bacterium]
MTEAGGPERRVGVLGHGSIGSVVARCLAAGEVPGAALAGVGVRPGHQSAVGPTCTVDELIERSDLIVEAAGQTALAEHGTRILEAGCDLLAVSTGALADPEVHTRFAAAGPGRLHICSGAIGGVDMVGAVRALGEIHAVQITTTKQPGSLVQPTMTSDEVDNLVAATEPVVLFDGASRELVKLFPSSTNVAATLALAVGSWDLVRGTVRADPAAELTTHVVEVEAEAGRYRFEMGHHPSAQNPRSSAVVPWAVVRSLRDLCGSSWRFT